MGTEGTPCWVGYHVTDAPHPTRLGFPSLSPLTLSTLKVTKSLLTQLAMEHSPKTFPISATSQEQRLATRWRHYLSTLSGLIYYLRATSGAEPTPPLNFASLPLRPALDGVGEGVV